MNEFNNLVQTIAVYAIPVLFAITLHESAHAYAAKYFGDMTAYAQGRLSLDPFKHIDLYGTILIPIILYIATNGTFLFGYAKPVPVIFANLRQPKRDMAWVALAGPVANFVMALGWMIVLIFLSGQDIQTDFFKLMAQAGVLTNLVMFAFNLFPVPPLDGGRIAMSLLPHAMARQYARIEPYGFFIVMILVLAKVVTVIWLLPLITMTSQVLTWMTAPFIFLMT